MLLSYESSWWQQLSTEINTIQQSQQKSAKVSKISPGPGVQSAKVSKNHQQSSEIITGLDRSHQKSSIVIKNHHFLPWFVNRYSAPQNKQRVLEHKGVCHRWAGNELQIPLAN